MKRKKTINVLLAAEHSNKLPYTTIMQMKELITELSLVEGEISRLEIQISHLQINLKQEQDETLRQATTSSSRRAWQANEIYNNDDIASHQTHELPKYPNFPPPSPMVNKGMMKNETTTPNLPLVIIKRMQHLKQGHCISSTKP